LEIAARKAPKPKPKFDPVSGKWVVMNWDGSVAGVENGDQRKFNNLSEGPKVHTQVSGLTESPNGSEREAQQSMNRLHLTDNLKAFAKINAIASDSPADKAGLEEEDLIIEFGSINHTNNNHLKAIADLVPDVAAERGEILITLRRKEDRSSTNLKTIQLKLFPRPWSGRGMIGCHMVPHTE
jgi:predicted metalloprotease with PDZ domain